jgi:hypothetical protein
MMNIKRCQIPANSSRLKISIERSIAIIPIQAAVIFRFLVESINAEANVKKVNDKPVIVANLEYKSSSKSLNTKPETIGACRKNAVNINEIPKMVSTLLCS